MNTGMSAATPRGQVVNACLKESLSPHPVDRWDLLSLVTGLRRELQLSDRDIVVLRAHLTVLPHGPLLPGKINMSFMEVGELLARACGMEERRFRRGEARLEQAGLIKRRLSGNGRRYPERDREGRIVGAYGIDLSPLISRHAELVSMHDQVEERSRLLRQRKNSLSARLQAALRLMSQFDRPLPNAVCQLKDGMRRAVRRKTADKEELDKIERQICELESVSPGEADVLSLENETAASPDDNAADGGQTVRHIESKLKEKNPTVAPDFDLARFKAAWARAETIATFYPEPPRRERDMAIVLFEFSSFLGLGQAGVTRGLSMIGWDGMILALDYLATKAASITRPEGYLRSMLKSYEEGRVIAGGRVRPPAPTRPAVVR